jgi:hypothetical protein
MGLLFPRREHVRFGHLDCNTLKKDPVCFPKHWYLHTSPHCVTTRKTTMDEYAVPLYALWLSVTRDVNLQYRYMHCDYL